MQVMILAAGRSTRLGALGAVLPKPLVPICGYPAIAFGLALCRRAGLEDVVVNLHHHGELIRRALGEGAAHGVRIRYSEEEDLLGTGGGIARARPLFRSEPVLVMNGKVVADLELPLLLESHRTEGGVATMLLRDDPDPRRWGAISVDGTGRVVGILDSKSPLPAQGRITARMFTGVHVIEPALLDRLAPRPCDVIRDAYIPALEAGARIMATRLPGYFAEHSTPERYLAGNLALLRSPNLLAAPPGPLIGVHTQAVVDPSAVIVDPVRIHAGAVIQAGAVVGPDVVVGAGARVAAGVRLQRAVIWAGVVATADAADAVLTPEGLVPVALA